MVHCQLLLMMQQMVLLVKDKAVHHVDGLERTV
jgi:hypothetical protein